MQNVLLAMSVTFPVCHFDRSPLNAEAEENTVTSNKREKIKKSHKKHGWNICNNKQKTKIRKKKKLGEKKTNTSAVQRNKCMQQKKRRTNKTINLKDDVEIIQNLLQYMSTAAATFQFEMSILNVFFFSFPVPLPENKYRKFVTSDTSHCPMGP